MMIRAAVLLIALGGSTAAAHEWRMADGSDNDARWIMNNKLTAWCCGPKDCAPIKMADISIHKGRYRVRGLKGSVSTHYPAQGARPWACRNLADNSLRCIFLPALN